MAETNAEVTSNWLLPLEPPLVPSPSPSQPRRGSLPASSSRPSLGLARLLAPVSLTISINNPLVFLHPPPLPSRPTSQPPSHPASPTSSAPPGPQSPHRLSDPLSALDSNANTMLTGSFDLKLLRPKEIKKMVVSLWGQSYIGFNDRPYENQTILATDLNIDLASQLCLPHQHPDRGRVHYRPTHKTYVLDKGHYRFFWSFILPSDLPPYERGQFGRTIHKVIGRVKFASGVGWGLTGSIGKNLSSILVGVGAGGHEIEAESYFVAVCNPASHDDEANGELALNFNVSGVSEHLGPYTLSASSAYFTVSGLLQFKFRLLSIPSSLASGRKRKLIKIYKITCIIKQQYKLVSVKDKDPKTGEPATSWPPCQRRKIFVLDHKNVGESDQDWHPDWSDDAHDNEREAVSNSLGSTFQAGGSNHFSPTSASSDQDQSSRTPLPLGLPSSSEGHQDQGAPHCSQASARTRNSSSAPPPSCVPRQPPASRSTSRSRSRIRDLIMTRASPARASSPSRDRNGAEGSSHAAWPSSFSQLNLGTSASGGRTSRPIEEDPGRRSRERARRLSSCSRPPRQPAVTNTDGPVCSSLPIGRSSPPAVVPVERSSAAVRENTSSSCVLDDCRNKDRGRSAQVKPRTTSTQSSRRRRRSERAPLEQEVPLVTITDDHLTWEIQHIGRLPNDDSIRPSTHPGTQTNIHIFHTLLFEISYSVEDEDQEGKAEKPIKRVLSISKGVNIVSCCCMLESMILPPYSKSDPNAENGGMVSHPTPHSAARMFQCVCGMSTQRLLETQNPNSSGEPFRPEGGNGSRSRRENDLLRSTTRSTIEFRSLPYSSGANSSASSSAAA